jgi:hypothetical protein
MFIAKIDFIIYTAFQFWTSPQPEKNIYFTAETRYFALEHIIYFDTYQMRVVDIICHSSLSHAKKLQGCARHNPQRLKSW